MNANKTDTVPKFHTVIKICCFFLNIFTTSKAITSLRPNGRLAENENENTLQWTIKPILNRKQELNLKSCPEDQVRRSMNSYWKKVNTISDLGCYVRSRNLVVDIKNRWKPNPEQGSRNKPLQILTKRRGVGIRR